MTRINWTRGEIIVAASLARSNGWEEMRPNNAAVRELSDLLVSAHLHPLQERDPNFRGPNSVSRKLTDISSQRPNYNGTPTKGSHLDGEVLRAFLDDPVGMEAEAQAIRLALAASAVEVPLVGDLRDSVIEGRLLLARHRRRERSPKLREKKLQERESQGLAIACEVCGFDFATTYGDRGARFIEVHHVLPLHVSGEIPTRLQDLALLCANCHRMIHRAPWTTPLGLKQAIGETPKPS